LLGVLKSTGAKECSYDRIITEYTQDVTGYGLDTPGIEFRWRRDFPHLSRPAPERTQPPVQWVLGLSRG